MLVLWVWLSVACKFWGQVVERVLFTNAVPIVILSQARNGCKPIVSIIAQMIGRKYILSKILAEFSWWWIIKVYLSYFFSSCMCPHDKNARIKANLPINYLYNSRESLKSFHRRTSKNLRCYSLSTWILYTVFWNFSSGWLLCKYSTSKPELNIFHTVSYIQWYIYDIRF